jgi:hypothetical protein
LAVGLLASLGCGRERREDRRDRREERRDDRQEARAEAHSNRHEDRHDDRPERQGNHALAPSDRHEERRDDRRDAVIEDRTGWDKLGEKVVHGKHDRDAISVGRSDGRFRKILVVVEHSALEMFDIQVTFGDGQRFSPTTRLIFNERTRSRVIDLPGGDRVIRKVEFKYGNLPGGGRAQVELWAR